MGCFLCCKKKKNIDLNAPLYRETIHPENDINENKNITLTVSEEKPPEKKIIEEEMVNEFKKEEHEESKIEITEKKQNYIIVENTKYSDKGLNLNENIGDDELLLKEDSP